MKRNHSVCPFLVLVFAAAAQAILMDPLMDTPPTWAGQDRTTFNAWDFSDVGSSLGGTQLPEVTDGTGTLSFTDWEGYWDAVDGFTGVVEYPQQLTVSIDNFPDPLNEKRIWLELNWAATEMLSPEAVFSFLVFSNSVQGPAAYLPEFSGAAGIGQDSGMIWSHSVFEIVLTPNPAWEDIVIDFESPVLLDSVLVHTICQVPEPATLVLLGIGGLALIRVKK